MRLILKKNELFNGIENKKDFYFVHSYYFECLNSEDNLASTNYDFEFFINNKKE